MLSNRRIPPEEECVSAFDKFYYVAKQKSVSEVRSFLSSLIPDSYLVNPEMIYSTKALPILAEEGDHDTIEFLINNFDINKQLIINGYQQAKNNPYQDRIDKIILTDARLLSNTLKDSIDSNNYHQIEIDFNKYKALADYDGLIKNGIPDPAEWYKNTGFFKSNELFVLLLMLTDKPEHRQLLAENSIKYNNELIVTVAVNIAEKLRILIQNGMKSNEAYVYLFKKEGRDWIFYTSSLLRDAKLNSSVYFHILSFLLSELDLNSQSVFDKAHANLSIRLSSSSSNHLDSSYQKWWSFYKAKISKSESVPELSVKTGHISAINYRST